MKFKENKLCDLVSVAAGFGVFAITLVSLLGLSITLLDFVSPGRPNDLGLFLFYVSAVPVFWIAVKAGRRVGLATAFALDKLKNFWDDFTRRIKQ